MMESTGRRVPEAFATETRRVLGEERYQRFMEALNEVPPVSIRLNPEKMGDVVERADSVDRVPWCPEGRYLAERPAFTFDPLLHAGCYYVQEAASMFVTHVMRHTVTGPVAVLDMCAAPGGKSTALRSVMAEGSVLVSNEPVRQRAQVLAENIAKWGATDCIVTNSMPRDLRQSGWQFDVVLCDVPCSGEGMFRKDEGAIAEWSPENVERCWRLQREIVSDAWACLRPGGMMIYSTCTLNTHENEENVRWMMEALQAVPVAVPTQEEWGITGSLLPGFCAPVYRFIPGLTRSEGLFVAVVRKGEGAAAQQAKAGKKPKARKVSPVGKKAEAGSAAAKKAAAAKEAGPQAGEALLASRERGRWPEVELPYPMAISYLRGEALRLPEDTPRGHVIVTYRGHALGFVKNIGSRANNAYPAAWRIKSTHVPEAFSDFL